MDLQEVLFQVEDNISNAKTFENLLECRQRYRDTQLSENTMNLKDVVLRLIDHHQHVDKLFEDLNSLQQVSSGDNDEQNEKLSVDMFVSSLQSHAKLTGTAADVLAALSYAKNLQTIVNVTDDKDTPHLLNDTQKLQVKVVLRGIHKLNLMHSFSKAHFIKKINSKASLPLELIWILHRESIMSINKFITSNLGRQNVFAALTHGIVNIGLNLPDDQMIVDRCTEIVKGFATFLVSHGYPANTEGPVDAAKVAVQKASVVILDTIMTDFIKKRKDSPNSTHLNILQLIRQARTVNQQSNVKFFKQQLQQQLTASTDIIVSQAISDQHLWTFSKNASQTTASYRELLLFFKEEEIAAMIKRLLEHEEVNWQALLSFISTFLVVCSGAPNLIKGLIDNFLTIAIDELDQDFLIIALLLARQAAAEGPQIFTSYPQWFKDTFGDGSVYITSKKSFMFLIKILTSIVPFEPAYTLKAHIQKPPQTFAKCQDLLCDYVLLAKTRLADLKETLEQSDTSESKELKTKELHKQAEADVEQAIGVFEATNQIPHSIIQASIFKYPYFMGRFLPVLLTPRMLPDVPDSRMKLIEMLKDLGKIPVKMMEKYKKACDKELNSLLEGIDMEEDDCEMFEPMDALKQSLDNLVKANKESFNRHLAIISERLQTVLCSELTPSDLSTTDELLTLDLQAPSLTQLQVEVTEVLLNGFCKACMQRPEVSVHWADNFVSMLSQFQPVLKSLMIRLCIVLTHQESQLQKSHIGPLSILLVNIHLKQDFLPLVTITGHGKSSETSCGQFLPVLTRLLSTNTGDKMKFMLQLSSGMIRHLLDLNKLSGLSTQFCLPDVLIEKFLYLVPRLYPESRYANENTTDDEIEQLFLSHYFKEYVGRHSIKFALSQWISNELSVQPHHDCISYLERKEYYRWVVNEQFGGDTEICSLIFTELVEYSKNYGVQSGLYVHNGCIHHLREKSKSATSQNGSQGEILQLLQEVCQTFDSSRFVEPADNLGWMMAAIQKRLGDYRNDPLEVACIMNIVTSLPAHLLVTNTPGYPLASNTLKAFITFINVQLRQNLMETAYTLPLHMTLYFARVLCRLNSTCLHQLKKECLLLMSSLLVHSKKLPKFSRSQNFSELLKNLRFLQDHAADAVSSDSHPLQFTLSQDQDLWLLCVALFSLQKHNLYKQLHRLLNSKKVLQYLFELSIADVAHSIFNEGVVSSSLQLAQNILEIHLESMKILTEDSILTTCVAPQTVVQLMPIALFRVYLNGSTSFWKDQVNKPSVLQIILVQHHKLVKLYTSVNQGLFNAAKGVSLNFMTSCFKFVKDLISKSHHLILQSLNPEILQNATPAIQSEIVKLLS
ncbi:Fanconi anemia group A protein-like [Antedon mediterranea]|uniref:Fanconi anemia group A protein-like n=1 Tax=Antedon mediterranea TaxID=105859 RepID=UPI003AF6B525